MATELEYLKDFNVIKCLSKVSGLEQNEDGREVLLLEKTCFYPRGGGQDWDTGFVKADSATFQVDEVRLVEDGVVWNIGTSIEGKLKIGETVSSEVNSERREINTRLHSAGHIVDMAVEQLQLDWIAGRGAHYPHMSFVEYNAPDFETDESLQQRLQAKIDELSASSYENKIMFVPVEEMGKYCRHIPDNIPTNKPSRIVLYADDFGIPCGGTHVLKASDIGKIEVTKIKAKKGIVKVSYRLKGIN